MKYKDGKIATRPYGQRVFGQWKQRGNINAVSGKKTVFVIPRIKQLPPGDNVSVLYTTRALYHQNRVKVKDKRVALVATSATVDECSEWIAQQPIIFETIEILENPNAGIMYNRDVYTPRGNIDITNEELYAQIKAGITFAELSKKYECTYHNLYNRYRRYEEHLNSGKPIKRTLNVYDIDNEELVHKIEDLGMSYHECAEIYGCTYQVIYARHKRYGSKEWFDAKKLALQNG